MIGSLIGAGVGAAASIFGGIAAAKRMREIKKNIGKAEAENQRWYDQRYNEDSTQRADAQALLRETQERMKRETDKAAGTAAVMGGTEESVALAKEANAKALADAVTNINTAGEARKANIEQQYMNKKDSLMQQKNNLLQQQANNIQQAAQGVASAASSAGGNIDELVARKNGEWYGKEKDYGQE